MSDPGTYGKYIKTSFGKKFRCQKSVVTFNILTSYRLFILFYIQIDVFVLIKILWRKKNGQVRVKPLPDLITSKILERSNLGLYVFDKMREFVFFFSHNFELR